MLLLRRRACVLPGVSPVARAGGPKHQIMCPVGLLLGHKRHLELSHALVPPASAVAGRERALSPTLHAAAPNAPRFLLLHVQRPDGIRQAQEFATALKAAGTDVEEQQFPGFGLMGHMEINRRLGDPGYAATPAVDAWLKQVFGR